MLRHRDWKSKVCRTCWALAQEPLQQHPTIHQCQVVLKVWWKVKVRKWSRKSRKRNSRNLSSPSLRQTATQQHRKYGRRLVRICGLEWDLTAHLKFHFCAALRSQQTWEADLCRTGFNCRTSSSEQDNSSASCRILILQSSTWKCFPCMLGNDLTSSKASGWKCWAKGLLGIRELCIRRAWSRPACCKS